MRRRSLRRRLGLAAAVLIVLALSLAGLGLLAIFDRVLDARAAEELDRTTRFLAGQVVLPADGVPALGKDPPDPRFETPYSGFYWEVRSGEASLRSRSLWDKDLPGAAFTAAAAPRTLDLTGLDGARLIMVARPISVERDGREVPILIAAASDRRNLSESRSTFVRLLVPSLAVLCLVLTLAMWLFVQRALAPLDAIRTDLRAIHEGRRTLMPANYPEEVTPLVSDLNRLIAAQEEALLRAKTQAGDMAHGLKTPLAVLSAAARDADAPALARDIAEQVEAMRRQVERSLVRARIASVGNLQRRSCAVGPVVAELVAALRRLPDAGSLRWEVRVPAASRLPIDAGDLTELLGNLLDNARTWAHRQVRVTDVAEGREVGLAVEDDGPGMSDDAMARSGRGVRWDETKPGSGFGLAISSDIAEETGGRLSLGRSPLGGLRVELLWPEPAPGEPHARSDGTIDGRSVFE